MQPQRHFYRYLRLVSASTVAAVAALDYAVFNDAPFRFAAAISHVAFADDAQDVSQDAALRTLLDVPAGQEAAFYRERLSQIQTECRRLGIDFEKAVRRSRPSDAPYRDADKKIAEVAQHSLRAVAYASEFPRSERDAAFLRLLELQKKEYVSPSGESATLYRSGAHDFFSELLAAEEAKTPVDVARVLELRRRLAETPSGRPFSKEGEKHFKSAAIVQASYARRLLETPENESGEFYLLRYNELYCAARASFSGEIASKEEIRERNIYAVDNEFRENLRAEADKLADRLAFADDLQPATRLEFFAAYVAKLVEAGEVEKLRDLYDRESVRDAENPFDAVRAPLVDLAILRARLARIDAKSDEQEAFELAYAVAERADDGEIAWEVGGRWALEARTFFERFEEAGLLDVARRLQDDVVAAFADSQDPTEQEVREELRRPAVAFDFSLLDVPEGESGEFYRERLNAIRNACRIDLRFDAVCQNRVEYYPKTGGRVSRPASPTSLEGRLYVVCRDLYERLIDAPDLAPKLRDHYFREYVENARYQREDLKERRDFFAELAAVEEQREPLHLARVLQLRIEIANAEYELARKTPDAEKKTFADFPALDALADDLAEKVDLARLVADVGTPKNDEERLVGLLTPIARLSAALPGLLAEERPAEETTEFYRQRSQELKQVAGGFYEPRRALVRGFLAGKLAYAEDLAPVDRFEAFQDYVLALRADLPRNLRGAETTDAVDRLLALHERETKRPAENPVDAVRVPYARYWLLKDWLDRLPQPKSAPTQVATTKSAPPEPVALSEEDRAELRRVGAELLEVVDDGPLAWELGPQTWSGTAENVAGRVARYDVAFATQLRKDLVARLADADSEAELQARAGMTRAIRQAELLGSTPTVDGRLVDGTPFDWATYRGAPVLIEIFRSKNAENAGRFESPTLDGRPLEDEAFFDACRDAGLQVVRYDAGKLRFVPSVATPGMSWAQDGDDWAARLGFGATPERVWILFDADGRVVATEPTPRVPNAPTLDEGLRRLFPNVAPPSAAESQN